MRKFYHRIEKIMGNVITLKARNVGYEDVASIHSENGISLAQVIKLEQEEVSLQVFHGTRGLSSHDKVYFMGHPMQISITNHLLGRIFTGSGASRDGKCVVKENMVVVDGPSVNPIKRVVPSRMIDTGIPMIDVFNTLVESQKLPIFSVPGEPYNDLLARIALQAQVDIIVFGGMGLKHDDYLFFRDTFANKGILHRLVMFVHTASESSVECLLVPDLALAVAEKFAIEKKQKVLVLLTDMTAFCDTLKEIAITMEQIPSNRGYPGDLYSQLARRYEKAVDFKGKGSMTVLTVNTMPGDDITHPIPDNTGYITEGQLYLRGGHIEPFGSLSRLKQLVNAKTRSDHRAIMDSCIHLYSECMTSREKKAMGFEVSIWDKKLLAYGESFEKKIMDLQVNIPLEKALDCCWQILAQNFNPEEVGITSALLEKYWPNYGDYHGKN